MDGMRLILFASNFLQAKMIIMMYSERRYYLSEGESYFTHCILLAISEAFEMIRMKWYRRRRSDQAILMMAGPSSTALVGRSFSLVGTYES